MKIPITGINSSSGQHHSNTQHDDLSTSWVDNRTNAWIQLNFGGATHISEVNVIFDKYEETVYQFSVSTSNDDLGFTHIRSASNKKGTKLTHIPINKTAQFVRLTIHENDSPNKSRAAVAYLEAIQNGDKEKDKDKDKDKEKETSKKSTSQYNEPVKVTVKEKDKDPNEYHEHETKTSTDTWGQPHTRTDYGKDKFGALNLRKNAPRGIECYQDDPDSGWFEHYEKHGYKSLPGIKVYRKECGFIKQPSTVNVEIKAYVRVSHLLKSFWKLQKSGKGKDIGDGLSIKSIGNYHNDSKDSAGCYITHFPYLGGVKKNCQKEKPHPEYAKITVPTEFDLKRWAETAEDKFVGFAQIIELQGNNTVKISAMIDTGGLTAEDGKPANNWQQWYTITDTKQIGNASAPETIPVFVKPNGPLTQFRMDNVAKTTEIKFASVREIIPE